MSLTPPRLVSRAEMMARVAGHIRAMAGPQTLRILEAGCGRHWPIDLAGLDYTLVGVDLDEHAVASRKMRFNDLDEIVIGDLRVVTFAPESFDVVYSAFVLEHVPDAGAVLQRFCTWLKPGGLMVLLFPDRDSVYAFGARITPFRFHVLYKKHLLGMKNAGKPGFGPYPTYHDRVLARDRFREFLAASKLQLQAEYGLDRLPYLQQKMSGCLSRLSLGRLVSTHINLCYVLQRPISPLRRTVKAQRVPIAHVPPAVPASP